MGGSHEVYTSWKQQRSFSYANVRKATYRGSKTNIDMYSNYSDPQHDISVQVLCDIWNMSMSVC